MVATLKKGRFRVDLWVKNKKDANSELWPKQPYHPSAISRRDQTEVKTHQGGEVKNLAFSTILVYVRGWHILGVGY